MDGRLRRNAGAAAAALTAALIGTAALAAESDATEIGLEYSSRQPGANTAMTLHIRYTQPGDPNAKPPAIRRIQIDAPAGTMFRSATVPACTASDAQVMAQGPSACPDESRIGGGTIRVITGFGSPFDPLDSPTPVFNDGRGWLEDSRDPSTGATIAVTRLAVSGSRISGDIGAAPGGPPNGESAVSTVDLAFPASTRYIVTPSSCPAGRQWTTTGTFTFSDGTTQTARGATPCVPAQAGTRSGGSGGPTTGRTGPAIRIRRSPHRVRAGLRARIRVALSSEDPRCVANAVVSMRGHRRRTAVRSDRAGRAKIVVVFHRSGRHVVTASKPGCRAGRAWLVVARRARRSTR